jgi:hypothetical protein
MREGPSGSHHDDARAEKCDISVSETDDFGGGGEDGCEDVELYMMRGVVSSWRIPDGRAVGRIVRRAAMLCVLCVESRWRSRVEAWRLILWREAAD